MSLGDALNALTQPGNPGQTVRQPAAPRGWDPGVVYAPDGQAMTVTTPATAAVQGGEDDWRRMVADLGLDVPPGWRVRLVEAKYDPAAWHRDAEGEDAVTRPVFRYRFAVEPDLAAALQLDEGLVAEALRRRARKPTETATDRALLVAFADPQLGKVDQAGGSRETLHRIGERLDRLEDHLRDLKRAGRPVSSIYWLDAGDGVEGFNNVTGQKYSNDLTMTEQVRVYRRIVFESLDRLAGKVDRVVAAVCGSNHAQVRDGRDPVGPPVNDWGIEVYSQVQDAYSRNPDRYGHVQFAFPDRWHDTLSLDVAGTIVGLAHGHQARSVGKVVDWWRGQTFGRQPIASARILVTGHWHHLRMEQVGDGRLWVMAPSIDNGSAWWSAVAGDVSAPGMLVMSVDASGWDDLRIL